MSINQQNQQIINKLKQQMRQLLNSNSSKTKTSYANLVKDNNPFGINKPISQWVTKHMLVVNRKDNNDITLNIKENFKSVINPFKLKTGIVCIKEVAQGKLIVECANKPSCDIINTAIQQNTDSKIVAKDDRKKLPEVILKSIDKTLSDQDIIDGLFNQNVQLTQVKQNSKDHWIKPKILFRRKKNTDSDKCYP